MRILTLVLYSWYQGLFAKTFSGWSFSDAFQSKRWKVFLPLVFPAMLGGVAEVIQMSLSSLMAARLGPTMSAASDLTNSIELLVGACVNGVAGGIGSLMARNLGQGLPKRSWEVTKVGMILVYGAMTTFAILMYIFNPTFARFASTDPLVQHQIIHIRFVSAFGMFMCGGLYLCADLICRQGRPEIVFTYLPIFNWPIGLPTSFFLTPILGIRGIWIGLTVGYTLAHAVLLYYLLTSDWQKLSEDARERSGVDEAFVK